MSRRKCLRAEDYAYQEIPERYLLKRMQQEKMKELWDNKPDEDWEWA